MRATFMPLRIICRIVASLFEAGPMVATILVRLLSTPDLLDKLIFLSSKQFELEFEISEGFETRIHSRATQLLLDA